MWSPWLSSARPFIVTPVPGLEKGTSTSMRPKTWMFVLGVVGDFSFSIGLQNEMPVRCAALLSCAGLSEEEMQSIIPAGAEWPGYRFDTTGGL